MARPTPVAYILDRQVFNTINASIDQFTQISKDSVKKLNQKLDEQMQKLEDMKAQMQSTRDSYQEQINDLRSELSDIKWQNSNNPEERTDTSGIEAQIKELETIRNRIDDNMMMISGIISKMTNEHYEYQEKEKIFNELLDKDLPNVKDQLHSLDSLVEDYSTKKIQL